MGGDCDDDVRTADAKTTLVQNERLKAHATYLNGLAVAILAIGGIAPMIGSVMSLSAPSVQSVTLTVVCFLISYVLHYAAGRILGGLEP